MNTKERQLQALLELSGRAGARPRPEIAAIALRLALPLFDAAGAVVALAQGRQVEGFADTIVTGAPMTGANVDDGLAAIRALVAISRSVQSGERVPLADVRGEPT